MRSLQALAATDNILLIFFLTLLLRVSAQDCSKENPCATGCCSKFGFCGVGDEFCGADCVDTCDYKLECDANNPCATGCCNKFGFCGLGPDYCGVDCVAGCDSKAYCDPGFGADWSEVSKCPLNVCCSKFGFCGTTEEFCGKRKVKRPSCPKTNSFQRVVGYYETWSTRRSCNKFWPERIPLGVYSHIIVAFAVVDPETFEIRPSATTDIDLYKRVAYLKEHEPDLKVFIAVGGWTYNDPGPTATTFSDLAASTDNQKAFFKSLTKFLSTYNFDGIDFDWEYPVADDRSGRPEDFENFSTLLKNLKSALKATGGRDGLSITLPASYWYLQHFDIQNLVKHVDFFNIMSYDLHGTWDKGNKWVGEYLNAHTNLTEITTALDLLWRNDIPPEKVVLGLAFYGRAFTVVDPGCTKPGCLFASGAEAGPCSNEVGILMNSEISSIISDNSLKPTLYKKEAVKLITWNNDQWVTYDDEDTWQIKTDFARGQCLGGVMVWAISHDTQNGTYSRALANVAGRKFQALPAHSGEDTTITTQHNQCKWTDCNKLCPAGWTLMRRTDPGARDGEWMTDAQGCHIKGEYHRLCCPPVKEMPTCGWWTHNNGDCEGKCPDGMFEIGSNSQHCSTAFGNYQAACCSTGKKNVALYDKCVWGDSFKCDDYKCPAQKTDLVALSCNGNGGSACVGDWRDHTNEKRKFCCDSGDDHMKWDDCTWEDRYTSTGYLTADADAGDFCVSNCPDAKVRVAMEHDDVCKRKTGSRARCCSPNYTTTKTVENPLKKTWEEDLQEWLDEPTCQIDSGFGKRYIEDMSMFGNMSLNLAAEDFSSLVPLEKRTQEIIGVHNQAPKVLSTIIFAYQSGSSTTASNLAETVWNDVVVDIYKHLKASLLMRVLDDVLDMLSTRSALDLTSDVLCDLQTWDSVVGNCTVEGFGDDMNCQLVDLDDWDPEYQVDPETYGTDGGADVSKRDSGPGNALRTLEKRDGSAREFRIDCGVDPNGMRRLMIITSHPYPNGDDGDRLQRANSVTVRFALANVNACYDSTIDPNSPRNIWTWVTEHILELQLMARSVEFMVTGVMPPVQGITEFRTTTPTLPWNIAQLLNEDYQSWARGFTTLTGSPMSRMFHALGSTDNPKDLVNTETHINSMKGRIFAGHQPIGDDVWKDMVVPDLQSAWAAINNLRLVVSVFEYLNDAHVTSRMISSYKGVAERWTEFTTVLKKARGTTIHSTTLWREFMDNTMARTVSWTGNWLERHLVELENLWTEVVNRATDPQTILTAQEILTAIDLLRVRMGEVVEFDTTIFQFL
ncbi:glycoside hydrolase family 18 protein [Aspergillus stella-maris]|uniref:glycoside hydrolase family 18 protein n=1 Tax=Aspergillus stella-maris TaxID=1810926 RepID=UPI003CCC98C7